MEIEKKLKILAASDLHGIDMISKDLARKAEKEEANLVIIAGDILNFGEYAKNMIRPFSERKETVFFVPGNHDPPEAVEGFVDNYQIKNLDGKYAVVDDVGFFGCGGSTLLAFPYSLTEEEIYYHLKSGFEKIKDKKKKVMVTHMHPAGSFVEKFSFPGSESVRRAIERFKPDFHICGHIHEMEGIEEKIENTTILSVGKRGTMFEL